MTIIISTLVVLTVLISIGYHLLQRLKASLIRSHYNAAVSDAERFGWAIAYHTTRMRSRQNLQIVWGATGVILLVFIMGLVNHGIL